MEYNIIYQFVISFFYICIEDVVSYNVDTNVPIVFKTPANLGGHFGFSVAFRGTDGVLVGAPKVNNDTGKVYECVPTTSQCNSLNHNLEGRGKTLQWFGVSVASQNDIEGRSLACSHRYYGPDHVKFKGICLLYDHNNLENPKLMDPCSGCKLCTRSDYNDCQVGFSAHIDSNGEILLGGPGFYDGAGNLFKREEGKEEYLQYKGKTLLKRNSYIGSSVRIGKLINNQTTYVTSSPKMDVFGKVFLFTKDPNLPQLHIDQKRFSISGDKPFSAFGADLAVGDFNSDGYEDLVVGAPYYYEYGSTIGGAIYIYMNGPEGITSSTTPQKILSRKMKESECLELECYDARFGFSLGSVGDLDSDGYPDLVVGAPFEGNGAIYIYSGSANGLKDHFTQRIAASNLATNLPINARSFGYSISQGPYDVDSNSYPDLAVGSFMSDELFVLRSRFVINVERSFQASPMVLSFKKPTCELMNSNDMNCVSVSICFKYSTKFDKSDKSFDMRYNITLPKKAGNPDRATFDPKIMKSNITDVLRMNPPSENNFSCNKHWLYVTKSNRNWLDPIVLSMSYDLDNLVIPQKHNPSTLASFDSYPVLNNSLSLDNPKILITFDQNCGEDNECQCNLKLLLINSNGREDMRASEILKLDVTITNSIEDAHQAMFYLLIPENIQFIGTESQNSPIRCDPVESSLLECEIANPLEPGENASFTIKLNPNKLTITQERIVFKAHVNSTSREKDKSDDSLTLELSVISEADFSLVGQATPSSTFYTYENIITSKIITSIQEIGPELEHVFEVKNVGKINLPSTALVINWPKSLVTEHPLFYVVSEPEVSGSGGLCNYDGYLVNPKGLTDKNKDKPQYERLRKVRESQAVIEAKHLTCDDHLQCSEIHCSINSLKPAESSVIRIYSRFWNSTFQQAFPNDDVVVVRVKARLIPPTNIRQTTVNNDHYEIHTYLLRDELKEERAPIWIYFVAAIAGLFLLILFIIILWKCGFFKRKKMEGLHEYSVQVTKKEINEVDMK